MAGADPSLSTVDEHCYSRAHVAPPTPVANEVEVGTYGVDTHFHDATELPIGPFDFCEPGEPLSGRHCAERQLRTSALSLLIPRGAGVEIERPDGGHPDALHIVTNLMRATITVLAAPRSGNRWEETHVPVMLAQLRADGMKPSTQRGPWGTEITVHHAVGGLLIVGIPRSRWVLRTVVSYNAIGTIPREWVDSLLSDAVIRRGAEPMVVDEPLDLSLLPISP
ncbi:DUF3710 domain-containing protein [Rhodococcus qingshengii]|uniref:DUF3710 domain-containing protein n=1 Tax=Rhodococcus qingshengii TaxID=334542 RepID=UPI0021B13BF0|nr:DUF3710 domain-containing protein [Rhodococcus qingshengii]MCT6735540.1 DUF3710 domain-containing protein [Rhodococcus qingshengii]